VGTSDILESGHPTITSWQVSTLTTSNFNACRRSLKEISTLAPFTSHYAGLVDDIYDGCIGSSIPLKRVPTNIVQMKMKNDDNDTSMMNNDVNMDDLKDYVGKSNILES
jgi:hypothetical protein